MMNLKSMAFISVCFLSFTSWADRSVNIATSTGEIELVNGSNVNVAYSIECYDKDSGTALTNSTAVSQNLISKKSVKYGGSYGCIGGSTLHYTYPQGAYLCKGTPATTNYATAAGYCGSGASLCTFSKLNAIGLTDLGSTYSGYWFDGGDPFYTTSDGGSTWSGPVSGSTLAPRSYSMYGPNYKCNSVSNNSGAISYCMQDSKTPGYGDGALCCPADNPFRSCKVTVHGTTGFLQSPQFKGGTPF
jgi:hypothetical protein